MTAQATSASPRRRRKRGNRVALLAGTLLASLALLAALEGLLRAADLGDLPPGQASKLSYQQVYPPLLEAGTRPDGTPAWITNDARNPWQALRLDKPADALRVVAVGGSATAGLGFSPNVTFSRELERLLRSAAPGREIEVLNLGIVALGSGQVRWIVDDACRRLQPDALLIYSGNNEFLELHAQKFAAARGTTGAGGAAAWLNDTNLFRLLGGLGRAAQRGRDVTVFDMAAAQARVSETEMMADVRLSDGEHAGIVEAYEENLRAMVASAQAAGAVPLLMTVASNWQWQGRQDLPAGWEAELLGAGAAASSVAPPALSAADLERALEAADERLAAAPENERHTWRFKRGQLLSRLGRWGEARAALREAMNTDPRLRRATDELADRARAVAAETGAPLIDTIALLSDWSEHGIVGDELFYDYVHFTPHGTVLVAGAVFDALRDLGLLQPVDGFSLAVELEARLAGQAAVMASGVDPAAIGDWLGVGDLALVHDRDLWKHQAHVRALDERLSQAPDDVDALVRRANAAFFMRDGYADAERMYEHALELVPDGALAAVVRENLAKLRGARRP